MLHSSADLSRMRNAVRLKLEPIYSGFQKLSQHPASMLSYVGSGAFNEIGRNPTIHVAEFDRDANAAYQCALMWTITQDRSYARLAINLVNEWSSRLKVISGADAILCASMGGFKMANAAELLRHTDCGWKPSDAERFSALLRGVFLPVIAEFAPFANGNWDTGAIKLMMALAIYDDDRVLFERAINYYMHGCGDGQLGHYIYANGQCQESGRDQQHTQLGLAHMGDTCEMAWHQGLDLYGALDNRLRDGFEYTAKYELGEVVPFVPDVDQTGKYRHAVISVRSPLRPVFEQIYNHYVNRMGLAAPWTAKAAEMVRPEGAPYQADATGFGTLLYTRDKQSDPKPPDNIHGSTVLYARSIEGAVDLDFVRPIGVERYDVLRTDRVDSAFKEIARGVQGTKYRDTTADAGKVYFYQVSGKPGAKSLAVHAMMGLPGGWQQSRVGDLTGDVAASFDGSQFSLSAGGSKPVQEGGPIFSVEHSLTGITAMTARLSPLVASGNVSVGLIVRDETTDILLSISPRGREREHPVWTATLLERGEKVESMGSQPLASPTIAYGRIRQALWLRMVLENETLRAAISPDREHWKEVGFTQVPGGSLRIGMFVASGIEGVSTEVVFDHVGLTEHARGT